MSSSRHRSNTIETDSQGNSPIKSNVSENYIQETDVHLNMLENEECSAQYGCILNGYLQHSSDNITSNNILCQSF